MQCACAILSSVACRSLQYFSTSYKWLDFRKKKLTNIQCVFSVLFCLKHFTFWEEMGGILSKMYTGLHVKYPLFLSDFNKNLIISKDFSKNTQISRTPVQQGPRCSMQTDGRMDMTKLIDNITNAPNKRYCLRILGLYAYYLPVASLQRPRLFTSP
jgi:hypothetical protein